MAAELALKAIQAHLSAAVEPVADRLLKRYTAEREALGTAEERQIVSRRQQRNKKAARKRLFFLLFLVATPGFEPGTSAL